MTDGVTICVTTGLGELKQIASGGQRVIASSEGAKQSAVATGMDVSEQIASGCALAMTGGLADAALPFQTAYIDKTGVDDAFAQFFKFGRTSDKSCRGGKVNVALCL
jgi:hypothetical protein